MFPALYHAHHSLHPEDLPFWLALSPHTGGPVLELGCGTGRVLEALALAGWQAFGLDVDAAMLGFLRQRFKEKRFQANVFQADMACFNLACQFAFILLPCNTLTTLQPNARGKLFQCVRRHLSPHGLSAASLPNPLVLSRLPRSSPGEVEETFTHPLTGNPVQVSSAWQRSKEVFQLTWHYDHLLPDGQVERLSVQSRHSLQPREAYAAELAHAGLALRDVWGDFDRSDYTEDSPNLIFAAGLGSN